MSFTYFFMRKVFKEILNKYYTGAQPVSWPQFLLGLFYVRLLRAPI